MRLVELTLVPMVAPGLFRSSEAIRAKIGRGELVKGVHWFQVKPRGRIHLDLDAVVEAMTAVGKADSSDPVPLARGGWLA